MRRLFIFAPWLALVLGALMGRVLAMHVS